MSMQDISDKELDQFFRNSTEEPNIPFDESAWAKMENSLNKHRQKRRRTLYRNSVLLVLTAYLLSTLSVRTVERPSDNNSPSHVAFSAEKNNSYSVSEDGSVKKEKEKEKEQREYQTGDGLTPDKNLTIALIEKEKEKQKEGKREEHLIAKRNKHHAKKSLAVIAQRKEYNDIETSLTHDQFDVEKTIGNNNVDNLSNTVALSNNDKTLVIVEETKQAENILTAHDAENNTSTTSKESLNSTDNPSSIALAADSSVKTIPADSLLPLAQATTSDSTKPKDRAPLKRRFSFGLFASPDYSLTSSAQWVSPGVSAGLFVEYHINHRWTIFAGLMKSSKIYSSNGADYQATDKYWAYKNTTSRIDGSCAVLDVPLNVKYHFYNRNKNLLFASAGVSSYFMLHEEYRFVYKNSYYADRSWAYNNKRNYFFGIVNLSVGYERYISKSFSVQVEPFIKIPLSTIGDGQVKLLTTGMFFYLKYSIH